MSHINNQFKSNLENTAKHKNWKLNKELNWWVSIITMIIMNFHFFLSGCRGGRVLLIERKKLQDYNHGGHNRKKKNIPPHTQRRQHTTRRRLTRTGAAKRDRRPLNQQRNRGDSPTARVPKQRLKRKRRKNRRHVVRAQRSRLGFAARP